jgi:hypothetical protein
MIAKSIRELLSQEPFHPFRIRASSGAAYDVRNPSLVVVLKSEVFVAKPNSDEFALIPLLHVAGIEKINGRPRGSRRTKS